MAIKLLPVVIHVAHDNGAGIGVLLLDGIAAKAAHQL